MTKGSERLLKRRGFDPEEPAEAVTPELVCASVIFGSIVVNGGLTTEEASLDDMVGQVNFNLRQNGLPETASRMLIDHVIETTFSTLDT